MASDQQRLTSFLVGRGFQPIDLSKLRGDASQRAYYRFRDRGKPLILMDAPPQTNPKTRDFVEISKHLIQGGLIAPEVIDADFEQGYLVLSDLGLSTARDILISSPALEREIFTEIQSTLFLTEELSIPKLPVLSNKAAGEMTQIAAIQYAEMPELNKSISSIVERYFDDYCLSERTLALRDFHVENVIWRKEFFGHSRVGLLDFQDAFYAPRGYDLVSLLRDVRYEVSPSTQNEILKSYTDHFGLDSAFKTQFHCLAIQRNLRILGVFARLVKSEGKLRYADFVPRTWELLMGDLEQSEFSELKAVISGSFPRPTDPFLESWGALH